VGTSFPCDGGPIHGFLWQHGIVTDYNVFAPPGSRLTPWGDGAFINDRGEIAGFNTFNSHAFLLVPCGEGTDGRVDAVEGSAATSNIPARSAGTLTTSSIQRPGMLAAWRARLAQRYRIPGLVCGLPSGLPNRSPAVRMCRLARMAAIMPMTRFRPSSIRAVYSFRLLFATAKATPFTSDWLIRILCPCVTAEIPASRRGPSLHSL
jgi:hypothetical protein